MKKGNKRPFLEKKVKPKVEYRPDTSKKMVNDFSEGIKQLDKKNIDLIKKTNVIKNFIQEESDQNLKKNVIKSMIEDHKEKQISQANEFYDIDKIETRILEDYEKNCVKLIKKESEDIAQRFIQASSQQKISPRQRPREPSIPRNLILTKMCEI